MVNSSVTETNIATNIICGNRFLLPESVTLAPQVLQQSLRSHSPVLPAEDAGHPFRSKSPYSQPVDRETKLQLAFGWIIIFI